MLSKGFECNSSPTGSTEEFNSFLVDFMSPFKTIQVETVEGKTQLVLNTGTAAISVGQVLVSTGDSTIDQTINKIVNRAVAPVVLKPQCSFAPGDNAKVAQWITELNATEV